MGSAIHRGVWMPGGYEGKTLRSLAGVRSSGYRVVPTDRYVN